NEEMTCRSHEGENHADCQNYTMHWMCHIQGYDQRIYNFKFDLTLHAELNVYLFQNVQTLPPQNLSVSLMTSGDFLLTWKAADGSQRLGKALEYEVTYKREWESWEKAASLFLSNTTHCHFNCKDLVPGSSYVARVRARPGWSSGFSGQYSEWSMEVSWETPEGSGLQPRNLRCLFNGADRLTCSWEVKKAIVTSVLFGLFFRATPASVEEECSPVHEKALPHIPYVLQSCEILVRNTSSQSQFQVSARAKTEEKMIKGYKNIKVLPPANVSVTMTENQEYELKWVKHTFGNEDIKQRYQVEYWKNDQYEKV
ncbi:IL3RB protein, partial [Corythaixoides concolor]|nr:IL3RB protein [Corythaixoides concolor]